MNEFQGKYQHLLTYLRTFESGIIAYSGGVDSCFLLKAVIDSGIKYLAVTAISPTMPASDYDNAKEIARELQAEHRIIESGELEDENFASNPTNRCFYCKSDLFSRLNLLAVAEGYQVVMDGSTTDDLGDYRPGLEAKELHLVKSPLIQAGLSKTDIRALSREMGLKTWDRPASPCLSSRIPYGERIVPESLRMVEKGEIKLRELGFQEVRVRKQGNTARVELQPSDFGRFMQESVRKEVTTYFKAIGFLYVTLDLEGYQSGKLNRVIAIVSRPMGAVAMAPALCPAH